MMSRTFLAEIAFCVVALAACGNLPGGSGAPTQSARATYPSAPSVSPAGVVLDFDNEDPLATTVAKRVSVRSLETGGGQIVQVPSGNGTSALRFPPYSPEAQSPRLVLVINPVGATDVLNPEANDFSFGADLRLNELSSGKGDDNGDNVLQRGLFSDASQYKLQVDKRVPSCTVKSGKAQLFVKFDESLDEGWFRVRCDYEAGSLTVSVSRILTDRFEEFGDKTASVSIGALNFSPSTPATVGGKIGSNGELVLHQSDQFNGELDNVFVDVPPRSAG
jgi:hypothetical protein